MTPRLLSLLFAFACAASAARAESPESVALWPEGGTPFARESDAETGLPALFYYPAPEGTANGCAVVVCPGGGYGGLAADHEGQQIARWWNQRGVSAWVLHYRLGPGGHRHPVQLADVQRALRVARSQAPARGLDPGRVGVMGFSAGGHLASMAATLHDRQVYEAADEADAASARPDFAILCYPVISLEHGVTHAGSRRNLLGPDKADDDEAAAALSSDLNVSEDTPPAFLFHTDEDTVVPAENALRFYLALRRHGVPAALHVFERGPHGVGLYPGDPVTGRWPDLLDAWMRSRGHYAPAFERVEVSGEVTLDGAPVNWGAVVFHPADPALPVVTARVMQGKFRLSERLGPPAGVARLSFSASVWEATRAEEDSPPRLLDRLSPGDPAPPEVQLQAGMAPLSFGLRTR